MRQITLSQGQVALVDDADFDRLNEWKWCARKCVFKSRTAWYAMRTAREPVRKTVYMHREIAAVIGLRDVDHEDGDGLNNTRKNLRPATRKQNMQNGFKRGGCSSRFKGVSWDKRDHIWRACIRVNGILRSLGSFRNELEAAKAYAGAAKRTFGSFART